MTTTTNKGYTLPVDGGDFDVWGTELNSDLTIIDNNLGGVATVNCAGNSNVTPSAGNAQNLVQKLTGLLTGNISYLLPAVGGFYIIDNETTGAFTITVKTSAGGSTGIIVPQGYQMSVWSDATNVATMVGSAPGAFKVGGPITGASTLAITGVSTFIGTNSDPAGNSVVGFTVSSLFTSAFSTTTNGVLRIGLNAASGSPLVLWFNGAGSVVGSVTTDGTSTTYNTTSDKELKIYDGPIETSGAVIDGLEPLWFRWKSEPDISVPGFFAQDVHRIYPPAVTKGRGTPGAVNYMPWQFAAEKLLPIVIAELQDARRRLAALEAK